MSQLPTRDDKAAQVATRADLTAAWEATLELPVQTDDGHVFQFDDRSERLMRKILFGWGAGGILSIDWRLEDNTKLTVTNSQLQAYLNECEQKQVVRGFVIDAEYEAKKPQVDAGQLTLRDLEDWKTSYIP